MRRKARGVSSAHPVAGLVELGFDLDLRVDWDALVEVTVVCDFCCGLPLVGFCLGSRTGRGFAITVGGRS